MLSKIVSVGDRIELKKMDTSMKIKIDSTDADKIYISKVYDVLNEYRLTIAMPIVEGRLIPLEIDTKYDISFISKKGLFQCTAVIVDRYKQDGLYVLVIELLSSLKKHQRRQYYRLDCLLEIKFKLLTEEEIDFFNKNSDYITAEGVFTNAIALDISGGGLRFVSSQKLKLKDKILLVLNIELSNDSYDFNILSDVRDTEIVKNRDGVYETRVEFQNLKTKSREILIKYIFEQDRLQRKK